MFLVFSRTSAFAGRTARIARSTSRGRAIQRGCCMGSLRATARIFRPWRLQNSRLAQRARRLRGGLLAGELLHDRQGLVHVLIGSEFVVIGGEGGDDLVIGADHEGGAL